MYQILHGLPQDPGELAPEAPQGLRQVLARCLSKEKSDRYALAMEMARDLDDCRVLQPDPALMHRIFSGGQETLGSLPRSDQTDRTQALSPQQAPWNLHRVRPWVWLGSAGAVALIALAIALKPPTLSNPEPAPERAEATAATPIPEKPANSAAPSKNKPATKTRGFWRRQVDCFKHGICDKPKYQDPPQGF